MFTESELNTRLPISLSLLRQGCSTTPCYPKGSCSWILREAWRFSWSSLNIFIFNNRMSWIWTKKIRILSIKYDCNYKEQLFRRVQHYLLFLAKERTALRVEARRSNVANRLLLLRSIVSDPSHPPVVFRSGTSDLIFPTLVFFDEGLLWLST